MQINTLVNSGATRSVINFTVLPKSIQKYLVKFKESQFNKPKDFRIKPTIISIGGAFSTKRDVEVFPVMMHIKKGDWTGLHQFVITYVITEDAIFGMNFLNKYN